MEFKKIIIRVLLLMLFVFILGAGVTFFKQRSSSNWSAEGIRAVKEGCLLLGESEDFCECYTNEIVSRLSKEEFETLTSKMKENETDLKRAKVFIDSVIEHCSEYRK